MRPLLLASLALSLAACDSTGDGWPSPGSEIDPAVGVDVTDAGVLDDLRADWQAAEPAGYWLRYETVCFCGPSVVDVRVIGGEIAEVRINGETPPEDPALVALTVLDLYDQALAAFAEADAVSVRVRSGAIPLVVSLDIDGASEIADDEIGYRVTAFAPLEVAAR